MDTASKRVGEARARVTRAPASHERRVLELLALCFLLVAGPLALLLGGERDADPVVVAGLVILYAVVSRVEFEVGGGVAVPNQLVFVPMLFMAPVAWVPLMVAAGHGLGSAPDLVRGRVHPERWLDALAGSWFSIGPVLVVALLAPGPPRLEGWWAYGLALASGVAFDLLVAILRERLLDDLSLRDTVRAAIWSYRIDAVLSPLALAVAVLAVDAPLALLVVCPLVWLLAVFSRERQGRYAAALELSRAYRGTVMLLSDVVGSDDDYTGAHSRSVVELAVRVGDELGLDDDSRQELEFAALLHDVGKLAIPKEIINKPGALTRDEYELVKTHTVEGQVLLDHVGGLLGRVGSIVRSCHERWDGGGYPDGLEGERIPLAARIVFCCDAYNAMTTDRPYRAAMPHAAALEELWRNAGTQFDPRVVAALADVLPPFEARALDRPDRDIRALIAGQPPPAR
jgi:HD-GYP domain-containing protein (c-di-GMP phosphodiesterase class II)